MPGAALPMETSASCSADQQRHSQWNIKIIISQNEKNRALEAGNGSAINSSDCSEGTISPDWNILDAAVVLTDLLSAGKTSLFTVEKMMIDDCFNWFCGSVRSS